MQTLVLKICRHQFNEQPNQRGNLGQTQGRQRQKSLQWGNAAQQAGGKMNTMGASAGKAAGTTGRFNAPVSYTHLTLPTTPYV